MRDGLTVICLAALIWLLYRSVTALWWMDDDLFHLHFLSRHSALDYCVSPRVCRLMSDHLFTPFPYLSYGLDLLLFGRNPAAFHAHQLLALIAAGVALYAVSRRWLAPSWSFLLVAFFVLGIPASDWVIDLMLRHYLEGLIWSAIALKLFVGAVRAGRPRLSILSSVFYFAAMSEKEIYVPLIGCLLVLPEGSWQSRIRLLRWHLLALAAYLGWRYVMLGTLLGGSGWAVRTGDLPRVAATLPLRIGAAVFGGPPSSVAILVACMAAASAWLGWRRRAWLKVASVSAVFILGPLIPAAQSADERFGMLPWLLFCALLVLGCHDLAAVSSRGRRIAFVVLLLGFSAAFVCNRADWRVRHAAAEQMSSEGRFFLTMQPGDLLRHPRIPPAAMNETRWFKEESLGLPKGAGWFADDIYLCDAAHAERRLFQYDLVSARIRDVTSAARASATRYCRGLRWSAPLTAEFEKLGRSVFWHIGPYPDDGKGKYAFVLGGGVESFPVPADAGYQALPRVLSLRIRYQSPAGWITFSPELEMDFRTASRYLWQRPSLPLTEKTAG